MSNVNSFNCYCCFRAPAAAHHGRAGASRWLLCWGYKKKDERACCCFPCLALKKQQKRRLCGLLCCCSGAAQH